MKEIHHEPEKKAVGELKHHHGGGEFKAMEIEVRRVLDVRGRVKHGGCSS